MAIWWTNYRYLGDPDGRAVFDGRTAKPNLHVEYRSTRGVSLGYAVSTPPTRSKRKAPLYRVLFFWNPRSIDKNRVFRYIVDTERIAFLDQVQTSVSLL